VYVVKGDGTNRSFSIDFLSSQSLPDLHRLSLEFSCPPFLPRLYSHIAFLMMEFNDPP
jgi:hypothetical protein